VTFREQGKVELEEFELAALSDGAVEVRTLYTLVSTGTELTVLKARFEAGSHWDQFVTFPFYPGYAAVGEIVRVGPAVEGLTTGDRVALRAGHASRHVVPALDCTPIPPGIDLRSAPWFALAKIAFMGARAAGHGLGDTVVVVGAGPIGQMSVRWANAAGVAALVVVDVVAARLALAERGGASAAIATSIVTAAEKVREALGGVGPDTIIDSTGNAEVLSAALGLVRTRGRVVVLGDTGTPTGQHLTSDVIGRGITVVGAHDTHSALTPNGERDPNWDHDRSIYSLFIKLVATGRFDLDGLTTHTFDPSECEEAYRVADERRGETLGILFDWTAR
jgi:2-desacetyl-2-hydroxyethyl bacteriochlorophyllide A dehydrogenase